MMEKFNKEKVQENLIMHLKKLNVGLEKEKISLVEEIENLLKTNSFDGKLKVRVLELENLLSVKRNVLKARVEEIFELSCEMDTLKKENGEKFSQINLLEKEMLEIKEGNEKLAKEASELKDAVGEKQAVLENRNSKIKELEAAASDIQSTVDHANFKLIDMEEKMKIQKEIHKKDLETCSKEAATNDNAFKTEFENLLETVNVLTAEKNELEQKCKDFEDENIFMKIKCEEFAAKSDKSDVLKSSSSSLQEELAYVDLETKIKQMEFQIEQNKKSEKRRKVLMDKMVKLSDDNIKQLDELNGKIQKAKTWKIPDCRFSAECTRLFCKFNHDFIFKKDNRIGNRSPKANFEKEKTSMIEITIKCRECDETFKNERGLIHHKKSKHANFVQCESCGKKIEKMEIETHIHNKHVEFAPKDNIRKHLERLNNGDGRQDLKKPVKDMVKNCVDIENDFQNGSEHEETLDEIESVSEKSDSDQCCSLSFTESENSFYSENSET